MHPLCCRVSLCSLAAQSIELCMLQAALSRRECINSDKLLDAESNFFSVKSGASHAAERIKVISHSHAAKFIHSPSLLSTALLQTPATHVTQLGTVKASDDIKKITLRCVAWKCDSAAQESML
jgi:hypothetical protein